MTTSTDKEAAILRRELSRVTTGRGKRYPRELRERVVAWAKRRRAAGASLESIKRDLGQRYDTVRRWCAVATPAPARALVPVRVIVERQERTVSVVSPSGFRVDGLSLPEAAALLRELG